MPAETGVLGAFLSKYGALLWGLLGGAAAAIATGATMLADLKNRTTNNEDDIEAVKKELKEKEIIDKERILRDQTDYRLMQQSMDQLRKDISRNINDLHRKMDSVPQGVIDIINAARKI